MVAQMSPYIYIEELQTYFKDFSQTVNKGSIWLEINKHPLPYEMPLGVALDMYAMDHSEAIYTIILHQRNCPKEFVKLVNLKQLSENYLNSLKEVKKN